MDGWHGLRVSSSVLLKPGTFVWRKGSEVLGIATADRQRFLGVFGLAPEPPTGADNVIISREDFAVVSALPPLPEPHDEQA
jgi:hypothetical protein